MAIIPGLSLVTTFDYGVTCHANLAISSSELSKSLMLAKDWLLEVSDNRLCSSLDTFASYFR